MFNEIQHQYSEHKNQELAWLPSDTEHQYQQNLISRRQELSDNDWIDREFTYKFNSHGFRSEEFTDHDSIMFLGCSMTTSIGLPLENTWAYQVANSMNLKRFNLAIGGTGPDTAFRLASHYVPQIKPKIVVYVDPPPGRFTLVRGTGEFQDFFTGQIDYINTEFRSYYEHWLLNEENLTLNSLKHKLAIQALCQQYNIKFVFAKSYTEMKFLDYARDLNHSGRNSNKDFAEIILNRINQNN